MDKVYGRFWFARVALLLCFAAAVAPAALSAQTAPGASSDKGGPQIAFSPGILDFGLVGVGRDRILTLKIQNTGVASLKGKATVSPPFSLIQGGNYNLKSGQSHTLRVKYEPKAPGTNSGCLVFAGGNGETIPVIGRARTLPSPPGNVRFVEEEQADFIVKYYTDQVSYILKPRKLEQIGEYRFQAPCDRKLVLKEAAEQARVRRDLAVVVLIHYSGEESEADAKSGWTQDLKALCYKRLVFLRGHPSKNHANDLPVLEDISLQTHSASVSPPLAALVAEK